MKLKTTSSVQKILFAFFAFIALLLAVRIFYSGKLHYFFWVWNIFLAWIPFAISSQFYKMHTKKVWKQVLLFCCWLAFFPNALYIITDLIHLQIESTVPKWFDALLLFSSSVVGLILAFISLYRIEKYLQQSINKKILPVLIPVILFLGSFGVYLGRFLRWNSWDILSNPLQLLMSIGYHIVYPVEYLNAWGITVVFTIFFYLLYFSLKKLPDYLSQANN